MLNPFAETNWNPGVTARRKFALSLIIGFPCIAIVFAAINWFTSGAGKPWLLWLGVMGCAVGAVLWVLPQLAKPFYIVWYFLACCIGIVVSNVVFIAFYYFVITPVGLLRRTFNPRAFRKGLDESRATYWEDAQKMEPKRYYRQF